MSVFKLTAFALNNLQILNYFHYSLFYANVILDNDYTSEMILEFSQDFNKRQKIWTKKIEFQQNTRIWMGTFFLHKNGDWKQMVQMKRMRLLGGLLNT